MTFCHIFPASLTHPQWTDSSEWYHSLFLQAIPTHLIQGPAGGKWHWLSLSGSFTILHGTITNRMWVMAQCCFTGIIHMSHTTMSNRKWAILYSLFTSNVYMSHSITNRMSVTWHCLFSGYLMITSMWGTLHFHFLDTLNESPIHN